MNNDLKVFTFLKLKNVRCQNITNFNNIIFQFFPGNFENSFRQIQLIDPKSIQRVVKLRSRKKKFFSKKLERKLKTERRMILTRWREKGGRDERENSPSIYAKTTPNETRASLGAI